MGTYYGEMIIRRVLLLPLLLLSFSSCTTVIREQTPSPPFSYGVEEVTVTNSLDNKEMRGILTIPPDKKNFPVVILASGSGPNDYNVEWSGHKPFWVIADYLTNRGIAVLRLNDRDYTKSPEEFYQNTSIDFSEDILSAIDFIRSYDRTRNAPIGLIGHSEGGITCTMAAVNNPDVSFLILLGSPGLTLDKVTHYAAQLSYSLSATPEDIKDNLLNFNREYTEIVTNYQNDKKAVEEVKHLYNSYFSNTQMYDLTDKKNLETKVTLPWYRFMYKNDPAEYLNNINIPVFTVIGEFDSQVTADENLEIIKKALSGKNDFNKIMKMKNLNHMLQPTDSFKDYSLIEETVSNELLNEVYKWILSLNI